MAAVFLLVLSETTALGGCSRKKEAAQVSIRRCQVLFQKSSEASIEKSDYICYTYKSVDRYMNEVIVNFCWNISF